MSEFNWKDEGTLDMTSDVSSIASEYPDDQDSNASSSTVKNRTFESILDSSQTHTLGSTPVSVVKESGRLSISQPILCADRTPMDSQPTNNSTSALYSTENRRQYTQKVPLMATINENKALKEEIVILKSKLSYEAYKVNELRALQNRDVQEILNEYFELQMAKSDVEEERRVYQETVERMQHDSESREKLVNVKMKDLESMCSNLEKEKKTLETNISSLSRRVAELEEELYSARNHETPSCLEAVKGDDSDWTIRSESDEVIFDLRTKLLEAQAENSDLSREVQELKKMLCEKTSQLNDALSQTKTFVIGGSEEAEAADHLKRIDELEAQLRSTEEQRIKSSSALVAYMSKCRDLEKQLRIANISTNNISIKVQNKEEMLAVVEKIRMDLMGLKRNNTVLREECARIIGNENQDLSSTELSMRNNLASETCDRSRLLKEDYEKMQLEIMRHLDKVVADPNYDGSFDQSVLDLLKEIAETTTNTGNLSSFSAFQGIHIESKNERVENQTAIDNNNVARRENLDQFSFMNSSLNDLINQSFNTSKEITNVKVKLSLLRNVMTKMFERLKGSANLFVEIQKYLGSGSEDSRKVANHIRDMHLEWAQVFNETGEIINVLNEAEHSIVDLHGHISMLEQSLNQSSFVVEASRRFSLENIAIIKDVGVGSGYSFTEINEIKEQLEKKIAENIELIDLVEQSTKARDVALSTLDNLKKQVKEDELIVSELKMEREHLMEQCEGHRQSENRIARALQEEKLKLDDLRHQINMLRKNAVKSEEDLNKKDNTMKQLEKDLSQAIDAKDELSQKVSNLQQAVISMRDEMKENTERRKQEMAELHTDLADAKRTAAALSSDLERANKIANQDARLAEEQKQCMEREKKLLLEELQLAKANEEILSVRLADLAESEHRGTRYDVKRKPVEDIVDISLAKQSRELPSRLCQTELTIRDINMFETLNEKQLKELHRLQTAYGCLIETIANFIDKPVKSPVYSGIDTVEDNCAEMVCLLSIEKQRREKLADEVVGLRERLEKVMSNRKKHMELLLPERQEDELIVFEKRVVDNHKYEHPLRQGFYLMTSKAADLVNALRKVSNVQATGHKVSLTEVIDMARDLRNDLNDRFAVLKIDKENTGNEKTIEELIVKMRLIEKENSTMYNALKIWKSKFEDLQRQSLNNPGLVERIARELKDIQSVMDDTKIAARTLINEKFVSGKHSKKYAKKPATT